MIFTPSRDKSAPSIAAVQRRSTFAEAFMTVFMYCHSMPSRSVTRALASSGWVAGVHIRVTDGRHDLICSFK
jgi:hypothetical protein